MNRLTPEQAARCATCCKYYFKDKQGEHYSWEAVVEYNKGYVYPQRVFRNSTAETPKTSLPLDPYFWFPRLWDKLHSFGIYRMWSTKEGGLVIELDLFKDVGDNKNPCLALCLAIEALEEK